MITIVTYKKDGVTYAQVLTGDLPRDVAKQKMLMEYHIPQHAIIDIVWRKSTRQT
jgi:hypothetical protein